MPCVILIVLGRVCHETRILLALERQRIFKKGQIPRAPDQIWDEIIEPNQLVKLRR